MLLFLQLKNIKQLLTLIFKIKIQMNIYISDTSTSQVQYPQHDPQTTQPVIQQQPYIKLENLPVIRQQSNIQLEKLSLQSNENLNGDHNQTDLQNPNPPLHNQSTAHTDDSNAILVPISLVTEQDPQHLTQDHTY